MKGQMYPFREGTVEVNFALNLKQVSWDWGFPLKWDWVLSPHVSRGGIC